MLNIVFKTIIYEHRVPYTYDMVLNYITELGNIIIF